MQIVAMSTDFFFLHVVLVVGFLTFYRCHILVLVFDPLPCYGFVQSATLQLQFLQLKKKLQLL